MMHVAWDILAIPGVTISVECLFSSVKHMLSDARSSMTAETISMDIVTKEWSKSKGMVKVKAWPGHKLHGFHQDSQ
jgi:hypothetical protein